MVTTERIEGNERSNQSSFQEDFHCLFPVILDSVKNRTLPLSIAEDAKLIADAIKDNTKEGQASIVGYYWGGNIALKLMTIAPERVKRFGTKY